EERERVAYEELVGRGVAGDGQGDRSTRAARGGCHVCEPTRDLRGRVAACRFRARPRRDRFVPMAQQPPWEPDDTGAVPVGPEPEPSGAGGGWAGGGEDSGGTGPGGWGEEPPNEPLAIAALVWTIVGLVVVVLGTILALALDDSLWIVVGIVVAVIGA